MIAGVVEGFYGRPWNARQRHLLFGWMRAGGLNTYLYAPKDDRKHRSRWRELYDTAQEAELGALIRDSQRHGLRFVYALAPGLDIRFGSEMDSKALESKAEQIFKLGCSAFAILFDDIPATLHPDDQARFNSNAHAQATASNRLRERLLDMDPSCTLWFCPTEYCGRMAGHSPSNSLYLQELGSRLHPDVSIFWTGNEIIAREIPGTELESLAQTLKRKPLLWDNLWANDYDTRRIHLGPFKGRDPSIPTTSAGILINPNCEFEANFVPIHTFARWCSNPANYQPQLAFSEAISQWANCFATGSSLKMEASEIQWLAEHFYLPYETGPAGSALWQTVEILLDDPLHAEPKHLEFLQASLTRLLNLQTQLGELENRDLLLALYRPLWDLKESLLQLKHYIDWRRNGGKGQFEPADHSSDLARGGLIAALQSSLLRGRDGSLVVSPVRYFDNKP